MRINGNRQILRGIDGGPRQRWIGCFRKQLTCAKTFFHLHHLSLRSAPPTSALRAPPSKGRMDRYTQNAPHSRPFLWKGLSSEARRGWLPPYVEKCVSPVSLSPPLSGIALYKNRRKAPHLLAFPIGEGGPRQRWIGCFRMQHKCAALSPVLPSIFHTIVTLSAPAGHLPLEGKATIRE